MKERSLDWAVDRFKGVIEKLNPKLQGIFAKWLETWGRLIRKEAGFRPEKLGGFKRGEIIYVDFGFNVGSEFGGVHYAVVVEENSLFDGNVVVVPLTSLKEDRQIGKIHPKSVYLGEAIPWSKSKTIAKPSSITSISKMRIIRNRKHQKVKLSSNQLTLIDDKIKELFTKSK